MPKPEEETVVSALVELTYCLNDEENGHVGTKIVWIGDSLQRIAEALERISPPPTKP